MAAAWKRRISIFAEVIADLLLEGLILAAWILITFSLTELVRLTIGQRWTELEESIRGFALLIVFFIGSLEFIVSVSVRTYLRLRKEVTGD